MKTKAKRFDYYQPFGDLADPEAVGLIACEKDFDYGTPNLERNEDISFVAANTSMQQCLLVRFKWRPNSDKQLVTLLSRMTLVLSGDVYEFEQIETYKPSESSRRPGRFLQYGSSASKLKLYVAQPYFRMRLVFNGHMRRAADKDESFVFVKLGCVVSPLTQVFDFLEQYDEKCLRQIYANKKPVRTFDQLVSSVLLHDRHEQKVRMAGEYLLIEPNGNNGKRHETFAIRGFYTRHFSGQNDQAERNITTRRLYCYMNNGQAFQVATRKFDLDEVDFGYTTFEMHPKVDAIDKPFKLDWQQLAQSSNSFELEISGQALTFEGRGRRKLGNWFEIETNGKPGWAWLSDGDSVLSTPAELEAISRSQTERELALSAGLLVTDAELRPCDEQRPLVVCIEDESCSNSLLVGAKAASLAQLLRFSQAGQQTEYKVPFGFVLTKHAHDLLLEQNPALRDTIAELQLIVGQGELDELKARCKTVAELISGQTKLPEQIKQELWAKLTQRYGDEQVDSERLTFAVRSSSWGEDEDDMSAAGQLSTILNVRFNVNELERSVMSCFASKFNYENIEYKRQHGLPFDLPMAVVVQEMVACQKAGVMFTCDPTTGDESLLVITANYGLGESVVSAQADPDSIRVRTNQLNVTTVDRASERELELRIEQISIGEKKVVISGTGAGDEANWGDKSKCCLNDEEILRLARCGLAISRFFCNQRRDIEWGYLNGELYLFQSRPVTGLESYSHTELIHEADRPSQAELNFYTRANIGEVMPYAIKPFTLTFGSYACIAARLFNKYSDEIFYAPQCSNEVYQECYHSFFNLRRSLLLPLSDAERSVLGKSMEIGFFGREMGLQPDIIEASKGFKEAPNPFQGTRFEMINLPLKLFPNRVIMREKHLMDKLRADVRSLKLAQGYEENKLIGLYNQLRFITRNIYKCWENHILIIMFANRNNMILSAVLSKYIKDPIKLSAATNKFLSISRDVISAEIPQRVAAMAKLVEQRGADELKRFVAMTEHEALEYLRSKEAENEQLSRLFEEFMQCFGHRLYNEFELGDCSWREQPQLVAEMVRKNCLALSAKLNNRPEPDSSSEGASEPNKRPRTNDEVIKSLNIELSFKDRLFIKHVIAPKCQQILAMREKTKNVLILYTDVVREASRMLAEEMQRQLRIPDKDLFYYLMFDEVKPLTQAHQPAIVSQAIRRRQMFKQSFSELWKFNEIISDITPNHLKPTKDLDEAITKAPRLSGTPASAGKVRAKVCLVDGYKDLDRVEPGTILVTHSTDIAFSPVFPLVSGIVTEVGGLISHGAVVAREYGLPSVIGIPDVMRILQDGEEIILDADNGAIIRLDTRNGVETDKGLANSQQTT